jgi:hypothetical protein
MTETQNIINNLNNAQFGSFGEFIFEAHNRENNIKRKHNERVDFILDGELIDIKATRKFKETFKIIKDYSGNKQTEIKYPFIQFYADKVVCVLQKKILFQLDYKSIQSILDSWIKSKGKTPASKKVKKIESKELDLIKNKLKVFFKGKGYKTRIIYRTTQKGFGKESPGNLLPSQIENNRVTIFLNFDNHNFSEDNLKEIFVIEDTNSQNLPLIERPSLHKEKVDLDKINQFKYRSINEIIKNWVQHGAKTHSWFHRFS